MLEFILLGEKMIFIFIFPIIGLAFDAYNLNGNVVRFLKYLALSLLIPLILDYNFRVKYLDITLILLLLSCFYYEYSKKVPKEKKGKKAFLWTLLLFLILGSWFLLSTILGVTKKETIYAHHSYSVYDHSDRGFSGGTAHQYELCHNALIPLYEKSIQMTKQIDSCMIHFTSEISFDRCNSTLKFKEGEGE